MRSKSESEGLIGRGSPIWSKPELSVVVVDLSYNSIILLYFDVFLFCILRNPNLQGSDFFFLS